MSEYLDELEDIFKAFLDGLDLGTDLLKKWNKFQKQWHKSVIAANEDIKGTDETVTTRSDQPSQSTPPKDESVDLEYCSDGVYRPKRERLDEK